MIMKAVTKKTLFLILIFLSTIEFLSAKSKKSSEVKIMYVSVETLPIKSKASALSSRLYDLSYGAPVFILDQKKSWSKICSVDNENISGWVSTKALTKKKLIASEQDVTTDAEELSLAGKGFNKHLEVAYSEEYDISFDLIDEIESHSISEEEAITFIEAGKLSIQE